MSAQQIYELVLALAPSVIAILTMVGAIARVLYSFKSVKKEVNDLKCLDEIKLQVAEVLRENAELKKTLKEAMTKIDHVKRD